MIGAFTDRMAGVLLVTLILSIVTVANRIHYTTLTLNDRPLPTGSNVAAKVFWRDPRMTLPYDGWVIAILAFVWLIPPDWLRDPTAFGIGLWEFIG